MIKMSLKVLELSGWNVLVENGFMKSAFSRLNMIRMDKRSSVLAVQVCLSVC